MWRSETTRKSTMPAVEPGERVRRMLVEELALRGYPRAGYRLSKTDLLEVSLRVSQRILHESKRRPV